MELLSSDVVAECTSMAGLGPRGSFKHITAGCYALGKIFVNLQKNKMKLVLYVCKPRTSLEREGYILKSQLR